MNFWKGANTGYPVQPSALPRKCLGSRCASRTSRRCRSLVTSWSSTSTVQVSWRCYELEQFVCPGQVFFSKNNAPPRVIMHVDVSVKLWAFFDLYGTTQKIKIIGIHEGFPFVHKSHWFRSHRNWFILTNCRRPTKDAASLIRGKQPSGVTSHVHSQARHGLAASGIAAGNVQQQLGEHSDHLGTSRLRATCRRFGSGLPQLQRCEPCQRLPADGGRVAGSVTCCLTAHLRQPPQPTAIDHHLLLCWIRTRQQRHRSLAYPGHLFAVASHIDAAALRCGYATSIEKHCTHQ